MSSQDATDAIEELRRGFRTPPADCGPRPLWFWNGALTAEEVRRQIDEMVAKGVTSAYVFPWAGMRPHYLSEGWWELFGVALAKAKEVGFGVYVADEKLWPSGEARDYRLSGLPSHVLERMPAARMRGLRPEIWEADGDGARVFEVDATLAHAIEGRRDDSGALVAGELRDVTARLWRDAAWAAPSPRHLLYVFRYRETVGMDGGLVDLMSREATRTFIDLVHEEYRRRFGDYFGTTLRGMRTDHEGDYGYRIAWTPALFSEFRERKGYDLVPRLPLLLEDGAPEAPRVRCDYLDVVSSLYSERFFGELADWCTAHGLQHSGHVWEESLHAAAAYVGSHFAVQRAFQHPGVDSVLEWARSPRHFKEAASVAHARRLPLEVEYQELEGAGTALTPELAKRTTNTIAAWGAGIFVPGSFYAVEARSDWPDQGFEGQPWWRFYRRYSDYVSRLAFINRTGRHVCEIALFYPIETAWANAAPCFREEGWSYLPDRMDHRGVTLIWNNALDRVNAVYGEITERLPREQRDFDVVDSEALASATIAAGRLHIGDESFRALVLPPMTCMRRSTAERVRAFAAAGGLVLAVTPLATDSMEEGADDPQLARALAATQAIRVDDVDALLAELDQRVPRDIELVGEPQPDLYCTRRRVGEADVYFLANDSETRRELRVRIRGRGRPERWDPDTGEARRLWYERHRDACEIAIELEPWQACHVVFDPTIEEGPAEQVDPPELTEAYELPGPWRLSPQEEVHVAYARTRLFAAATNGASPQAPGHDDSGWEQAWLSSQRFVLLDWWLIGPFDHGSGASVDASPASERGIDLDGTHDGKHGAVAWREYRSPTRIVDLEQALGLPQRRDIGRSVRSYAFTWVRVDDDTEAELRVTADANAAAWVNGECVFGDPDEPARYLEYHDGYAERAPIRLRRGWNAVLLKVSQSSRYSGPYAFVARICRRDGRPLEQLRCATRREDGQLTAPAHGERWYRFSVPPGASRVRVRACNATTPDALAVYLDGEPLPIAADGVGTVPSGGQLLAVRLRDGADLADMPVFAPGSAEVELGSLTATGLAYHSGTFVYETAFQRPAMAADTRLELDLGRVGAACEAWLNDDPLGTRIWRPYTFDITDRVEAGANRLRVLVANTRSQRRAAGPPWRHFGVAVGGPDLLPELHENGLLGPVRILARSRAA